jgi:hypothetical protein
MSIAKVCVMASMAGLLWATVPAVAQTGLRLSDDKRPETSAWPQWRARFGLATSATAADFDAPPQVSGGQLLGDYYWSSLGPVAANHTGGFRATSGLLFGQRSVALGVPALASTQGLGLTLSSRGSRLAPSAGEGSAEAWLAVPYFGIGYSGISLRGGWGFTADLGLAGTGASGLSMRRDSALGSQGLDDLLRELRLTPVLQIGASYAF